MPGSQGQAAAATAAAAAAVAGGVGVRRTPVVGGRGGQGVRARRGLRGGGWCVRSTINKAVDHLVLDGQVGFGGCILAT